MYFQTFFFLLFSESESARAKNSPQIKRFFFGGGGVTVLWPLPFYVEGCDIVS